MKILILAALPQEYLPLKKLLPSWRLVGRKPFKKFGSELPGKEIILIESGMGAKSAEEALETQLAEFRPDLLIFCGFAGGLHPDLPVGAVFFASSVREISSGQEFRFRFPDKLVNFLTRNRITPVLALSAEQPGDKRALSSLAAEQAAVLDMETATLARMAFHNEIAFICFRAISDSLDHDLGFNLNDIAGERGRIRITGVLVTVIRKPQSLKAFYLAWRRSRRAAKNLCGSVAAFLELPAPVLGKMAGGLMIERN